MAESSPQKDTMGQTANEESMDVEKENQEQPSHSDTASVQSESMDVEKENQEQPPHSDTVSVQSESMDVEKENQEQPPHSDTASVQSAHPSRSPGPWMSSDDFNWDTYLKETASIRAPSEYFRQSEIPPVNEFKVGMKLEARDPRSTASVCIASVIATSGARLRLRLDGAGSQNDFWRLVDSSDIQPVGTCEKGGELLKPPLGFQMNISFWPIFLLRTLTGSQLAPAEYFKKEPPKPQVNNFKVGMKIEAVDRKNPAMICPATIGAVQGDRIHIILDGWSTAFSYWCPYDSRDIFPVGWCLLTRDYFHPPGNTSERKTKPKSKGVTKALKDEAGAQEVSAPSAIYMDKTEPSTSEQEQSIPVVPSTSLASLRPLVRKRKDSVEGLSKTAMSTVKEETTQKKSIKRSQHSEPYLAPVSVKKAKITIHASKEEVLSPAGEEHGMPKEETFPEDSKNLSVGDLPIGEVISPSTSEIVPSTSSLDLIERNLPTQSSYKDPEFKLEKKNEGEVLCPAGEGHGMPKEETSPEDSKNLSVGDFPIGEVISPSTSEIVPSTSSLDIVEKKLTAQSTYEDTECKLEKKNEEEVLSPAGEEHGMPKEEIFTEDSKDLSVGDFSIGEIISPSTSDIVPSTSGLDLVEKKLSTQSSYKDTECKLEKKNEEEVLSPAGEGHGMPKEETFTEDSKHLSVGDFSLGEIISPSTSEIVPSTSGLDLVEKMLTTQSTYEDTESKLEKKKEEEVLCPAGEGHGMPKEETSPEDSKNLSVGDFPIGEVISPSTSEIVPSTSSLDLVEKNLPTQSTYEDTECKLEKKNEEEVLSSAGEGHGMPKEETFPEESKTLSVGDFSLGEIISPSTSEIVPSTSSLDLVEKKLPTKSTYEDTECKLEKKNEEEVLSPAGQAHGMPKEETFPEDPKNLSVGDFSVGEVISPSTSEIVPSTSSLDIVEKNLPTQSSYEDTEFKLEKKNEEEVLCPAGEGHGIPKEETVPEDSKNLSVGEFSVGEIISPSTSEIVPSTSSLDIVEKKLTAQSTYEDTECKLEKKKEGN